MSNALAASSHRRQGLGAVVHAAQGLQVRVVEALHPDGQARDARAAIGAKPVLQRCRVGLHGDFAVSLQPQAGADVAEQAVDGLQLRTGWACRHR